MCVCVRERGRERREREKDETRRDGTGQDRKRDVNIVLLLITRAKKRGKDDRKEGMRLGETILENEVEEGMNNEHVYLQT